MDTKILAQVYQKLTSNIYAEQTTLEMADEIVNLKEFLRAEANLYGLLGIDNRIHSVLVVEELDNVHVANMMSYMKLMHYDVAPHIKKNKKNHEMVAQYLLIQLHRRLEEFRLMYIISDFFFGPVAQRLMICPGIFFHVEKPDLLEVQLRGPEFYFPKVGDLTIETLLETFNFREMLNILYIIGGTKKWKLNTSTTEMDVAQALLMTLEDMAFDPRAYLTLYGPVNCVLCEPNETIMPISDTLTLEEDVLIEQLSSEGLNWFDLRSGHIKPVSVMFEEYTTAQLTENFTSNVGPHRSIEEASFNEVLTDGTNILEIGLGELVFYGKRDGISKMWCYSLEELYKHFVATESFYTPESVMQNPANIYLWVPFQISAIQHLLSRVLPTKRKDSIWTDRLTFRIQSILAGNSTHIIEQGKYTFYTQYIVNLIDCNPNRETDRIFQPSTSSQDDTPSIRAPLSGDAAIKSVLYRMFNIGTFLVDWDSEIDYLNLNDVMRGMEFDVQKMPLEPSSSGRIRAVCRNLILQIQGQIENLGEEKIFFEKLRIIKLWNELKEEDNWNSAETKLHIDFTNDSYTIGRFLEVMHMMAKFNLEQVLRICGIWLMTTASFYFETFFGISLHNGGMSFQETSLSYDIYSDYAAGPKGSAKQPE